ncbi:MAG: phage holin family protein [Myxococcaceae bacterium]
METRTGMHTRSAVDGIATHLKETVDAVGHLLASHLKLARLELIEAARKVARSAGAVGAFVVLAVIGYVFFTFGAVTSLRHSLGWPLSCLIVGGLHTVVGGLGAFLAMRGLTSVDALDRSENAARYAMAMWRMRAVKHVIEEQRVA